LYETREYPILLEFLLVILAVVALGEGLATGVRRDDASLFAMLLVAIKATGTLGSTDKRIEEESIPRRAKAVAVTLRVMRTTMRTIIIVVGNTVIFSLR